MNNKISSFVLFIFFISCYHTSYSQEWKFVMVGNGTKPELDLDTQDKAHVTYMFEDFSGTVEYAKGDSSGFVITKVKDGYFYAPLDLCVDQNGKARIVYHDHDVENLVQSTQQSNGSFSTESIGSSGHDGWYPSLAIDANNNSHIISVDPSNGIEYATLDGFSWNVSTVRKGPTRYEWGTSLLIDDIGTKHAAFFVQQTDSLYYSTSVGGAWNNEFVKRAAYFPSLELDENRNPVMTFVEVETGINRGNFKIAERINGIWHFEDIGSLTNVVLGFSGARGLHRLKIVDGVKHFLYSDKFQVMYAKNENGIWQTEQVVNTAASGIILGQHVDMDIDSKGNVHIVYHESGPSSSKDGTIFYGIRIGQDFANELSINCPDDTEVSCSLEPDESLTGTPNVIFNSGTSSTHSFEDEIITATCTIEGDTINRTWTVQNNLFKESTCVQQIISKPTEDKIFYPEDKTFNLCYVDFLQIEDDSPASTSCDDLRVDSDMVFEAIDCGTSYQITKTWRILDDCNNIVSSKEQLITLNHPNPFGVYDAIVTEDDGTGTGSILLNASCGIPPYTYDWSNGLIGNSQNNLSAAEYVITITDQAGCQTIDSLEVILTEMVSFFSGTILDQVDIVIDEVSISAKNITTGEILVNCSDTNSFALCSQNQFGANDKFELCISKNTPISEGVSAQDIVKATRLILGLDTTCPDDVIATDVDYSQTISARDLVIMRKAVLGLQDTFPDNRNWLFFNAANEEFTCDTFTTQELPISNLNIKAIKLGDLKCPTEN